MQTSNTQELKYLKNNFNNNDEKKGILKFSYCDNKDPLWKLKKDELKAFIKFAKKFEQLEWKNIKHNHGFNFEKLDNYKLPSNISKDVTAYSMRLSKKFRIIGFKENEYFYIIWFKKNHNY